jgi:hypothetical protein
MTADIQEIFERVFKEYGYEDVTARWDSPRLLKMSWVRTGALIDIFVPDYLQGMDDETMEELAQMTARRIVQRDDTQGYPEAMYDYLLDRMFRAKYRPTYLTRTTRVHTDGAHVDLDECVKRLVTRKMLTKDEVKDLKVCWCGAVGDNACESSTLFRTVLVNIRLDATYVPEELVDYVVYSGIKFVNVDFKKPYEENKKEWKALIGEFPDADEYMKILRQMNLQL